MNGTSSKKLFFKVYGSSGKISTRGKKCPRLPAGSGDAAFIKTQRGMFGLPWSKVGIPSIFGLLAAKEKCKMRAARKDNRTTPEVRFLSLCGTSLIRFLLYRKDMYEE
jgi:hypothetical protein